MHNDSDSPGTGESQYPSGGTQFPSGGSQTPSTGSFGAGSSTAIGASGGGPMYGGNPSVGYGGWGYPPVNAPQHPSYFPHGPPPQMWYGPPSNQGGWVYTGPPGPSANTGRPLSTVGDYRPNMDAVNNPVVDTTTTPFSLADFDNLTFEQLGIAPGRWDSAQAPQPTPASGNRGGGRSSRRGGGSTGRKGKATAEAEGGSISATDATHYTREESIAVTKAWIAVSEDAIVGTDQTELGLWTRIVKAYEAFKPEGAKERTPGMLRKKWGRISPAIKRFAGIYDNNLRHADSGMSLEDIKELSMQQHILKPKFPKFTYWDEYLLLRECPKFQSGIESGAPKRTRLGVSGNYSSGSAGSPSIDLNEDVEEEPPATSTRRRRPMGKMSAIRNAKAGLSAPPDPASGSSGGLSRTAVSALTTNVRLQTQKQLFEVLQALPTVTRRKTKKLYVALAAQLTDQLGIVISDDEVAEHSEDEVVGDSEDETE